MITSSGCLLVALLSFLDGVQSDHYTAVRWLSGQDYARTHRLHQPPPSPSPPSQTHTGVSGRPLFSWDLPVQSGSPTGAISQVVPSGFNLKNRYEFETNQIKEVKNHTRNIWWPWKNYKEWLRSRGQNNVKLIQQSYSKNPNIQHKTNVTKLQRIHKKKNKKKNHYKKQKHKNLSKNNKQTVSRPSFNISEATHLNKIRTNDTNNCIMPVNKEHCNKYLSGVGIHNNGLMKIYSKAEAENKHKSQTFNDIKGTEDNKYPLTPVDSKQTLLSMRRKDYKKGEGDDHSKEYEAQCFTLLGSYKCQCPLGFRFHPSTKKCLDVNECIARNGHGPCQGECTNTMGSYTCSCANLPGTRLANNGHSCEDIDECDSGTNLINCSHGCINTVGTAFCYCPDGYQLDSDWRTCKDIDECASVELQSLKCIGGCVNTEGSYKCV